MLNYMWCVPVLPILYVHELKLYSIDIVIILTIWVCFIIYMSNLQIKHYRMRLASDFLLLTTMFHHFTPVLSCQCFCTIIIHILFCAIIHFWCHVLNMYLMLYPLCGDTARLFGD